MNIFSPIDHASFMFRYIAMEEKITRRRFGKKLIIAGSVAIGALGGHYLIDLNDQITASRAADASDLLNHFLFSSAQDTAPLAKTYIAQHGFKPDTFSPFMEALWTTFQKADKNPDAVKKQLAKAIQEDYQQGRTVSVRGWFLSETECKLYAWFYQKHKT
ncbi:hypothetical protein ACQZV8_16195 [Magnetococcales bacterium HHB-1]